MTDVARHSRRGLYAPLVLALIALAAWTGWWFYLSHQVEQQLTVRTEALRQAGWTVRLGDVSTNGWPFRIRLQADNPVIVAPSGQGLAAPQLVAEAAAYNPDRWVIVAPDGLTLNRGAKGEVGVRGDALRFSANGLTERFPRLALELVNPVFTAQPGAEPFPISRAGRVTLETRANAASAENLDVRLYLADARGRSGGPVEGMTGDGALSLTLEGVVEDAAQLKGADTAGVFSAWTRAGGRFSGVRGEMSAGDSRATLASDGLSARPDGRLEGVLTFRAEKSAAALAGLAGSQGGLVNRAGAAGAAAVAAGGDRPVDLTVTLRDGRAWLGPFAIAPAPKLF